MTGMKHVQYRGGLLQFRVPSDWVEEYEHDGGGSFYADKPDSGTLRLSVLTFEGPGLAGPEELLGAVGRKWGEPEVLPSGNVIVACRERSEEAGQNLAISYWNLAGAVPPRHIRLAVFSYTVLEHQVGDPRVLAELSMLDQEIRTAVFSRERGVLPA